MQPTCAKIFREVGPPPGYPFASSKPQFELDPFNADSYPDFIKRVVTIANNEWMTHWKYGTLKETSAQGQGYIQSYWDAVPANRKMDTSSVMTRRLEPWSAAFISWVMKTAGAGNSFHYAAGHSFYIRDGKTAKINSNMNTLYWLYEATARKPRVGDMVCNSRSGSGLTYANADDGRSRASHCDIIVEVLSDRVRAIGGNAGPGSDTVYRKDIFLNSGGYIDVPRYTSPSGAIFGILSVW